MRTKQQSIELLTAYMQGKIPVSKLKLHKFTWLHLMKPDQREKLEGKLGPVKPQHCSPNDPNEKMIALWDGIPIGLYLSFHMSMFEHPDSQVEFINCEDSNAFNEFFNRLPQKRTSDRG